MNKPIAVVIDNNQPGWTNIVETEPNVTLDIGTKLYVSPSPELEEEVKILKQDLDQAQRFYSNAVEDYVDIKRFADAMAKAIEDEVPLMPKAMNCQTEASVLAYLAYLESNGSDVDVDIDGIIKRLRDWKGIRMSPKSMSLFIATAQDAADKLEELQKKIKSLEACGK